MHTATFTTMAAALSAIVCFFNMDQMEAEQVENCIRQTIHGKSRICSASKHNIE